MHFAKLMTGDFTRCMNVPKKFMKHFKNPMSKIVDLKGPSGNIWHVTMIKIAGDLFLQSGWKDFVKAHYIQENDLLVFKHNTNSGFDVLIFEGNGCEKASSFFAENKTAERSGRRKELMENQSPLRHVELSESSSLRNSYDDIQQETSNSGMCNSSKTYCRAAMELQRKSINHGYLVGKSKGKQHNIRSGHYEIRENLKRRHNGTYFLPARTHLTVAERKKVLQLALAVQPGNPFFVSVMQKSNCHRWFTLTIPSSFAAAHLPCESQDIILQVSCRKKEWVVSYFVMKNSMKLLRKWRSFVLDNNLEVGDLCLFELMKGRKLLRMTVHISKH